MASGPAAGFVDQNMPAWMQPIQQAQQGGQVAGMAPAMPQFQPGSLSVGSLLSEDALPDWMRDAANPPSPAPMAVQQPRTPPAPPPPQPQAAWGMPQPAAPSAWEQPSAQWQPAPAGSNLGAPPQTAASALFDDSALPEWLREAAAGQPAPSPAPWGQPAPSAFMPSNQPVSPFVPSGQSYQPIAPAGGAMPAQSLLDTSALPQWLGGPGSDRMAAAPEATLGGEGLRVNTLVDERSLPLWLRQEPSTPSVQPPAPGTVTQWLAAPVTDEPLPTWLNQVYASAQVPRIPNPEPIAVPWGASNPGASPAPALGSVPVAQLVDETVLPDWLRAQADPPQPPSPSAYAPPPAPVGPSYGIGAAATFGAGIGGPLPAASGSAWDAGAGMAGSALAPDTGSRGASAFSASDLIDPEMLPKWVANEQQPAQQQVFSSTSGWTSKQPAYDPSDTGLSIGNGGWSGGDNVAYADESNLPPWLLANGTSARAASGGQQRRGAESGIPDHELPPWLRGNAPAGVQQPRFPPDAGYQPNWHESAVMARPPAAPDDDAFAFDDLWDEPTGGQNMPAGEHYADRYADERPNGGRPFGYEYDHGRDDIDPRWQGAPEDARRYAPHKDKQRRRWFGRK
ncbi:MAG TPA: hypothetical protein VF818_09010 [Ktedonobacterales bacterium]